MEKLGWRDRRISPDSGSLFQTIPKEVPPAIQIALLKSLTKKFSII